MATGSARLWFEAGRFVYGQAIQQIKGICFRYDIDCDIQTDKGWLSHTVYITLKGDKQVVDRVAIGIYRWIKENE